MHPLSGLILLVLTNLKLDDRLVEKALKLGRFKTKEQAVALLEKSIADATATLKSRSAESFHQSVQPWMSVIEHSAEHYGLLVAYYRANGMVPPASRKK